MLQNIVYMFNMNNNGIKLINFALGKNLVVKKYYVPLLNVLEKISGLGMLGVINIQSHK